MWEAHKVPFSLGFEGERWVDELPGLVIPIQVDGLSLMVTRYSIKKSGDGFAVVHKDIWHQCEDLIMASALAQHFFDSYHVR